MNNKAKIHKRVPKYHVVQQFLSAKNNKKEFARTAAKLKYSITGQVLSDSLDTIFKVSPHYKQLAWGNLFPVDVNELGEGNSFFFKSEDILCDFEWLYLQVSKYKAEISDYVTIRDSIEKSILLGTYNDALDKLEIIHKKYGVSVWYYEMKLLIYSYSDKEDKSLELLTEINLVKKNAKHGFVTFLLSYLYKRCSKDYSAFAYDSELENKFKLNRTEFQKDRYSYYLFRLNFYKSYKTQDMSPVLIMEATNSLIDRYNIFLNLVKAYFTNSKDEQSRRLASAISTKFYRKTNDPQLAPLVAYVNVRCLDSSYFDQVFLDVLDTYYKGNYKACIKKCKSFVFSKQPSFDILKIYCRSLIALQKMYMPICKNEDSIMNRISNLLFLAMTSSDNDGILNKLYQLNKNIYGLSIAGALDEYLWGSKSASDRCMRYLALASFDPLYTEIYDTKEEKKEYLMYGAAKLKTSAVVEYQKKRVVENVESSFDIAKYIVQIDSAKIAYLNAEYDKALNLWLNVLNSNHSILPIEQCAINYIFKCYLNLNKKQKAIEFYVSNYLKGKAYTNQISTKEIIDTLYREKYKNGVKNGLDLQLFVFLNATEDEKKSALLERYCSYKDVETASGLISILDEEFKNNQEKAELYLFLLASEDILRHMVYVTSTKKMIEERQVIAQYLTSFKDSSNIEKYKELNQELLDTMIVYQNIRKIDESKIFVNQSSLLKYEFAEFEGLYNQFKNQFANAGKTTSYYIVNSVSDCTDVNKDRTLIRTHVKFTNKAFIDSACQVFTVIRDKFLFSKFGLKTYLSTRIRHGVLEGVLRSGYDGLHLLLTTMNNKYLPIMYWKNNFGLTVEEQKNLMKMLEKFSSGVNHAIETFKEEALQIKIEDSDKGMFDYRLTPDDMCYATVLANTKAKDYSEFCLILMEYMLNIANCSLGNIRREITGKLKSRFNVLVENLAQDIQLFSDRHFFDDLSNAVNSARANTIMKIAHIEKWFYLQDAKFEDFSLVKQIKAVWQVTSKMYPNINTNVDFRGLELDIMIKSVYVIHISDMLTIFYNNMFGYSKVENVRRFKIELIKEGNTAILSFENKIGDDEVELNARFQEMLRLEGRLQMEGRSGLVKVNKIIKDELGCKENSLDIKAENGICKAVVTINLNDICV